MIYCSSFPCSLIGSFSASRVQAHSGNCIQRTETEGSGWTRAHGRGFVRAISWGLRLSSKLPVILRPLNQLTNVARLRWISACQALLILYMPVPHWPRRVRWPSPVNMEGNWDLPLDGQSSKEFVVIFNPLQCHRNTSKLILLLPLFWREVFFFFSILLFL